MSITQRLSPGNLCVHTMRARETDVCSSDHALPEELCNRTKAIARPLQFSETCLIVSSTLIEKT